MVKKETPDRILDVAERMFSEKGFEATSLRDITERAKANVAAVSYHFGSKRELFEAVIKRRLVKINARRLELLDQAEAAGPPDSEQVLRALLAPTRDAWKESPHFMKMAGRIFSEPNKELAHMFLSQFGQVVIRFRAALTRSLPGIPVEDLFWRVHFIIGAMCHTWTASEGLEKISDGMCSIGDGEEALEKLVTFTSAGLTAPVPAKERK